MFAVLHYPLTDVRPFIESDTGRSLSPAWPVVNFPDRREKTPFVRGFGQASPRWLGGLEEWSAETSYCDVSHALRLKHAFLRGHPMRKWLALKAYCALRRLYWDGALGQRGSVVGRVEVGFGIKPAERGAELDIKPATLDQIIDSLLAQPAYLLSRTPPVAAAQGAAAYFELLTAGEHLAGAYLRATTISRKLPLIAQAPWWVQASSPMVVVECNESDLTIEPPRAQPLAVPQLEPQRLALYLYKRPFRGRLYPVWIIVYKGRSKDVSRRLRINLSRLHSEISALKVVSDLVRRGRLHPSSGSQADQDFQSFLADTLPYLSKDSFNGLPNFEFLAAALTVIDAPLPGELHTLRAVVTNLRPNLSAQVRRLSTKMDSAVPRWDFFIAHAGADKAAAEQLHDRLSPQARVFLDSKELLPGDQWDLKLPEAQAAALITIVLISGKTTEAHYERAEIARAIQMVRSEAERHRVVPVYLPGAGNDTNSVPYGLETTHSIRLASLDELAGLSNTLLELLARVKYPTAAD